jgi:penicillin-binding protein 2
VERIDTAAGAPVQEFPPRLRRRVAVKPQYLDTLQRALAGTTHEKGTAYDARLRDIEVSGKTGTAQVRRMKVRTDGREHNAGGDHAWFVGFAPTRRPQIAVVVLVEHGGLGGHVAAPVAMEIIRGYFEQVAPEKRVAGRGDEAKRPAEARPLSDLPTPQLKDLGPTPTRAGVGGGR